VLGFGEGRSFFRRRSSHTKSTLAKAEWLGLLAL
jgi:hypothetical protein